MGTLFLSEIRKRTSGFLQDKYKTARLVLTDVTATELLAEEATNSDPWGPDAKTMTRIAEASFDVDDYWRIVDVLHKRLYDIDWKLWRQSYKALVLLEFLLTHGPENLAEEFHCDADVIRDLGAFKYIDDKGFNWGASMQKKSERILKLLCGGEILREARYKALKITKEIKGFGNLLTSPSSSSGSSTPSSSQTNKSSGFGSYPTSSSSTPTWHENNEFSKYENPHIKDLIDLSRDDDETSKDDEEENLSPLCDLDTLNRNMKGMHLWDVTPVEEKGCLLNAKEEEEEEEEEEPTNGLFGGICSKFSGGGGNSAKWGRSISDVGRDMKKKMLNRNFSLRY